MFDSSKHATLTAAVLSGVTVFGGTVTTAPAVAAPTTTTATVSTARHCAVLAVPPDGIAKGERPVLACAASRDEAMAQLDRAIEARLPPGSVFATASSMWLATHYRNADASVRSWTDELVVTGGDCSWVLPDTQYLLNDLSATRLGGCSATKQYKGTNFTGESFPWTGGSFFSLNSYWDNQIRSVKYGA
jgi:hypothetical protein